MLSKISHINCGICFHCKYNCSHDLPALLAAPTMIEEVCESVAAFVFDYVDSQTEQFKQIYELFLETRDVTLIQKMVPETTCETIRNDLYTFIHIESNLAFEEWKAEHSISERAQHFLDIAATIREKGSLAESDKEIYNDYRIFQYLFDRTMQQRAVNSFSGR